MKKNWYSFDHEAVNKRFTGGLTYLNDMCVNGEYYPVAVYHVENPDLSKGHKEYLLLQQIPSGEGLIRGMTLEEITPFAEQAAIKCNKCQDIIYSVNRHDCRSCECGECSIDGGKDYTKWSGYDFKVGTINLLIDEFY